MTPAPLWAVSIYWHLPVLLVVISLVYSATRHDDWRLILREGIRWLLQLVVFLVVIGLILWLFTFV
jgi:hypothetical protein